MTCNRRYCRYNLVNCICGNCSFLFNIIYIYILRFIHKYIKYIIVTIKTSPSSTASEYNSDTPFSTTVIHL